MIRHLRHKVASGAVALLLAACSAGGYYGNGNDNYFSSFKTLEGAQWNYAHPLVFEVDTLADSISAPGALLLTLRHSHDYAYSNVWLELTVDADDTLSRADTLNIVLADDFGNWRGRGSGPLLQVTDTVALTTLKRHQRISLRHIMRCDTLDGFEQIGFTFLPPKK